MWRSHLSYHPRIGYTYLPHYKGRHLHQGGGYLVRANGQGFRSEREFTPAKPSGVFRVLLFGDSQTAGLGVSNRDRFSDLVEKAIPGVEVFNYGVDGIGVDQQHLAWREFGQVEHDLLVLALFVHDAARVNSRFHVFRDQNGEEVFYAKPYYTQTSSGLELQGVPVPKRPLTRQAAPTGARTRPPRNPYEVARTALRLMLPHPALRKAARTVGLIDLAQKVLSLQRTPEYDTPGGAAWLLLRDILTAWISQSPTPVLLFPIPSGSFVDRPATAAGYQARLRELAAQTGARLFDPLPDLMAYSAEERRGFRFKSDDHLTASGHQAIARALAPAIQDMMQGPRQVETELNRHLFARPPLYPQPQGTGADPAASLPDQMSAAGSRRQSASPVPLTPPPTPGGRAAWGRGPRPSGR